MHSRITVVETPDSLLFVNEGIFVPGSVENVLRQDAPQRYYPNRQLMEHADLSLEQVILFEFFSIPALLSGGWRYMPSKLLIFG
jgi:hypothetical protein